MARFAIEMALKGVNIHLKDVNTMMFNPYNQFPKHQRKLPFMDRPFGPGYETRPDLSRFRPAAAVGTIVAPAVKPAAVVAGGAVATYTQYELAEEFTEKETSKDPWWLALVSGWN